MREGSSVDELLTAKGLTLTDFGGWVRLDAHELAAGAPHGRARVKHISRAGMSEIAARR
jgi:ferredoxin--NADP+ reductase